MKRLFDVFFSILGLIILFPILLIVSILVKTSSKGPLFFIQERVGKFSKYLEIIEMVVRKKELGVSLEGKNNVKP